MKQVHILGLSGLVAIVAILLLLGLTRILHQYITKPKDIEKGISKIYNPKSKYYSKEVLQMEAELALVDQALAN